MPKITRCWGIDIGQCAIKALRCSIEDGQVVADAFDYIEYPKILSQPEAEPEALVREALETFLSRNEISRREDKVAISVPGQSGLAKFFKPPPVDVKKIPDIVQYEAKQQIPFPLEEVIWDYQKLIGGAEVDGFAIDAEVGLFAMKREQVHRALRPFDTADIQLDIVQLAPMSIYNFVSYDILTDGPDEDLFDADDPPESIVVLSMGTDATDLVITNGFRMWQRSIPLGGNHFTKQLTKELKLTFAKAEHLKRNARQAEDPKTVFQAMRPVFNDLVTEVQRSIGYFQGIDRKAKIKGVVLLGNTVKLPGLQQYIAKNLGYEMVDFDSFNMLGGPSVISSPQFSENVLAYGVSYGLCLQGLGKARLSTNLLPREILTKRLIKSKKPWAVASLGALMLACSFNFFFHYNVWSKVKDDYAEGGKTWSAAEQKVSQVKQTSDGHVQTHATKAAQLKFIKEIGAEVVGAGDRRLLWLELMRAVNEQLPWPKGMAPGEYVDFTTLPIDQRPVFYVEYMESEYFPDLSTWWTERVADRYFQLQRHFKARKEGKTLEGPETVGGVAAEGADPTLAAVTLDESESGDPGPTGPGWVIELKGYHYYNHSKLSRNDRGPNHVRFNFLEKLENGTIALPVENGARMETFDLWRLGVQYPILAVDEGEPKKVRVPNPDLAQRGGASQFGGSEGYGGMDMYGGGDMDESEMMESYPGGMPGTMGRPGAPGVPGGTAEKEKKDTRPVAFDVKKYSFTVQFCWQENLLGDRLEQLEEDRKKKAEEAAAKAAAAAEGTADGAADPNTAGVVQPVGDDSGQ